MAEDKNKIVALAKKRFNAVIDAQSEARSEATIDTKMLIGGIENTWEPEALKARTGRPTLNINKLPKFLRAVTGDQRRSRPSIKVRPVDSKADQTIATVLEGHIRNIEYTSNAAYAYDSAFKHATSCGFPGYWRILSDYNSNDSFEQDILIAPIRNHMSVYMDHSCPPYQGKEKFCFVVETIRPEEFKSTWPGKDISQFLDGAEGDEHLVDWYNDEEGIRVAEYFYREPCEKTILLLQSGEVVEVNSKNKTALMQTEAGQYFTTDKGEQLAVVKSRTINAYKIMWCKICGLDEPLEGPLEVASQYIPVVPVLPEEFMLEGKPVWKGIIRDARDSSRQYDYAASANIETIALSNKSPLMIGKSQLEGNETQWKNAHLIPYPYLVYNDSQNPNMPQRTAAAQQQPGLLTTMQQATADLEDTIGIYRAGLGAPSNEKSGIAIRERKESSDVGTYEYHDNLSRAIQWGYRILLDMIPRIYDTERGLRLMNPDDTEAFAEINKTVVAPDGSKVIINDITQGKYDIAVTLGPSYATQRQEGQQILSDILTSVAPLAPQTVPVILPRLFKMIDLPEAAEITKELKSIFGQGEDGKEQQPNPMQLMQQEMAARMAALEIAQKEAEIAKTETESMLNIAKAEAAEVGQQLATYAHTLEEIKTMLGGMQTPPQMPMQQPAQERINNIDNQ